MESYFLCVIEHCQYFTIKFEVAMVVTKHQSHHMNTILGSVHGIPGYSITKDDSTLLPINGDNAELGRPTTSHLHEAVP